MAVTQYIGARYVPIFANPYEWDNTREYEPLTIVSHNGNSYTSRQAVAKGIDILNEDYWALTGDYNTQVEQYRNETKEYKELVTSEVQKVEDELDKQTTTVTEQLANQDSKITTQLTDYDSKIATQFSEQDSKVTEQLTNQNTNITNQLTDQNSKVTEQLATDKAYVDTEVAKVANYKNTIIKEANLIDGIFPYTVYSIQDPTKTTQYVYSIEVTANTEKGITLQIPFENSEIKYDSGDDVNGYNFIVIPYIFNAQKKGSASSPIYPWKLYSRVINLVYSESSKKISGELNIKNDEDYDVTLKCNLLIAYKKTLTQFYDATSEIR